MKKIPTLFERDWTGDRSRVTSQVTPGCEWVVAGEGVATRKLDGTACMIRDGKLYKRRELRQGEPAPSGFELADYDALTEKSVGWVPCGNGPEDKWHREAYRPEEYWPDGTYELVGPKIQGNPEKWPRHELIAHGSMDTYDDVPRTYEHLRDWLSGRDIEGIVFHHSDGRMAKIKLRDYGLKRKA